ncbi:hypothetical protein RB601_009628 [Gaeumannomyces tritici]
MKMSVHRGSNWEHLSPDCRMHAISRSSLDSATSRSTLCAFNRAGAATGMLRHRLARVRETSFISNPQALCSMLSGIPCQTNPGLDIPSSSQERLYRALTATHNFVSRPWGILDSRAWAFQERLLSRRIISITREGLFWDCLHHSASDRRPAGIKGDHSPEFRDSDDRNLKRLLLGALPGPFEASDSVPLASRNASRSDLLRHWRRILQQYTKRSLTYQTDKLVAADGVMGRMGKLLLDDNVLGICRTDAVRCLLWFEEPRFDVLRHLRSRNKLALPDPAFQRPDPSRQYITPDSLTPNLTVPSWSWAGSVNPIQYRLWHPRNSNQDSPKEQFTELATVKSMYTQRSDDELLGSYEGLLVLEGHCVYCFIHGSNVHAYYSAGRPFESWLRGRRPRDGSLTESTPLLADDVDGYLTRRQAHHREHETRRQTESWPEERLRADHMARRDFTFLRNHFEGNLAGDAPRGSHSNHQNYEMARLLLVGNGGYDRFNMGQHCMVLRQVGLGWKRIGICVFEAQKCCLQDPRRCQRGCISAEGIKPCLGFWDRVEVE